MNEAESKIVDRALSILERELTTTNIVFDTAARAKQYVTLNLAQREREVFGGLFLDTRHQLIEYTELFYGTLNRANIHAREVVKAALNCNAGAVIIVHNHPSGNPEPSQADVHITGELKSILEIVDVQLLDHLVVGHTQVVSLAERGLV